MKSHAVKITLPADIYSSYAEMSDLSGRPLASLLREVLTTAKPQLDANLRVTKLIKEAQERHLLDAKKGSAEVDALMIKLEQKLLSLVGQNDEVH